MISEELQNKIRDELEELKSQGLWGYRRIISSAQGAHAILDGRDTIILTSTNYLGLASDPEVVQETEKILRRYGAGESSGPRICGVTDIHLALEEYLAHFHKTERALLFPSCFLANVGAIATLVGKGDAIFSDALNHASIIDGCRLSGAKIHVYPHLDLAHLEKDLAAAEGYRTKLIVTDGVFSMDGDLAPLPDLISIARRYNAVLMVDDAHGVGVLGENGRGTPELFGVEGQIDILTSTLGKAMSGSIGGYIATSSLLTEYYIQKARTYRFTNVVPAHVVASALAAFKKMESLPEIRTRLWDNTRYFRRLLTSLGFEVAPSQTPILPVMIRDGAVAMEMSARLLDEGVFVQGYCYPVVPRGEERLRCIVSAAHTRDDLDAAAQAFERVGRSLGILK
ncbi:MAG: glycine C-acetyltransferase [Candidatus Fermentithermobacillus carboniphilus]|uniref:Glycine C-acetyltransferase n=1 Tax=Candidatus Fermentithermobacillus carboniphilus TaxID=3085328 RepID=A0AAT9LE09_9FIRM|nr:MAG: glycine C-acetyltransferase [Candidatus Fermentithermobacillus carboniphilus]